MLQAPALLLASLHAVADVGQVLEDQGCAGLHGLDHTLGEHMVAVPAETFLAARDPAQVTLGRPCAFRLERAAQTERAGLHFAPVALTEELGLGCHGGARNAEVNANHLATGFGNGLRGSDDNMEPNP
ncbi:MAG TPA: hypothetical protein VNM16_03980, partial [Bacillota bacterium]|nr:hypothetical protein [Bacillota bacterium]